MANRIRVLVVDDSAFMRTALTRRIELDQRFEVIDTAEDGKEAIAKVLHLKPDVITMDVEMPVMNGMEALKAIMKQCPTPVIMVSAVTLAGAKITLEALDFGAVDFIPKARRAELIHEKLLAAASANIGLRRSVPLTPLPPPPPMPVNIHHRFKQAPTALSPASQLHATPAPAPQPQARKFQAAPAMNVPRPNTKLVLIGSSTGGPQALQQVVSQLPDNLPAPVVIAQHMPPQFTLALAKRLDETCPPKVVEAENGMLLQKGTVYIAQGGMHLRVAQDRLSIDPDKGESLYKPSVDVLAESALHAFGKNVLGVMLTGMGNDGARAFVQLHRAGGYNISQDAESCVVYGMPRSVVEAGGSDEVAPLNRIGQRIREMLGMTGGRR